MLLNFTVSVLNNAALAYHISVPLHIVFRSGGLIVNMIMGWLVLNKRWVLVRTFLCIKRLLEMSVGWHTEIFEGVSCGVTSATYSHSKRME